MGGEPPAAAQPRRISEGGADRRKSRLLRSCPAARRASAALGCDVGLYGIGLRDARKRIGGNR